MAITGQPADFQLLTGAARVGRLISSNLQLSKFDLHYAVTHDQSHYTQGAALVVPRKVKCHHNLGFPTVLLFDPGWSAPDKSFRKFKSGG
jgi:hypothetical protein